jgi:riboflavin biosynthesis pyrimidine reductase
MTALEVLFPARGQPEYPLPAELKRLYGGPFGLPTPLVYSNFVTSLDGVAVVGPSSGSKLSGQSQADRFVMGLLRAGAEAIVIGSGTLAGSPGHVWSAEHVFPAEKAAFRELRGHLGRAEFPLLVVVTGSGAVDLDHPGLRRPALILTSDQGRTRLGEGSGHQVVSLGPDAHLDPAKIVAAVREAGHQVILTEGGPQLMGQLLQARQLNQLFLTISPRLAGRPRGQTRDGFVAGVDLLREKGGDDLQLLSVHRHISHLFLRYLVETNESQGSPAVPPVS